MPFPQVTGPPDVFGQHAKYITNNTLGQGSFGIVYQARAIPTGTLVAVKMTRLEQVVNQAKHESITRSFHTELNLLRKLSHPYIAHYIDHSVQNSFFSIVLELAPYGDLESFFRVPRQVTDPEHSVAGTIACQCLSALAYIHAHGVVHRLSLIHI